VTLQAWEDFQCPYCKQANQDALSQVIKDYVQSGRVKIVYRHFAFLGDESSLAAQASEAAAEQGMFWEYHDALFAAQAGENRGAFSSARLKQMASNGGLDRAMFDAALDSGKYKSVVQAETSEGRKLGIDSTPVFFVNGVKIPGAQPYSVFKSTIESALGAQ
jgi:protein-disulfide isomerase